ncbi:GspH/FimT family pseudopilin [Desulfobacula toluolica]|uniref:Type II secretion system protein H n=1 Tax=Desulfobacula toluolica (strain DSM 7467 / Tol2) TaxID=651182 RepID=K0NIR6_DESTT|nr:GspH/FimT family pseudopilin [Desulfobacula toluolica]CCK78877.1 uncharacterized protein containing N-terminal methylation motif [Desulfobacula toluolica Tol2]
MKEIGDDQISNSGLNSNGFTIIEIISVLIIIGILSAVIVPKMTATGVYDVISETQILKTHLRYAQSRAMSYNEPWGISMTAGSYTLQKNNITASVNFPNETSPTHFFSNGVGISSGNQVVSFDDLGSPGDSTISFTLSHQGSHARTITITRKTGFID